LTGALRENTGPMIINTKHPNSIKSYEKYNIGRKERILFAL